MKSKILIGALALALGLLTGGLEGLILAAVVVLLLAIPNHRSKRYIIRIVA
ncbi:MAG: hypothetical protein QXP94_02565 [Thermofilaceae archaeon]